MNRKHGGGRKPSKPDYDPRAIRGQVYWSCQIWPRALYTAVA